MSDAAHPLIGRTLGGRFTITGYIGEGAMAAVYRGEQMEEPRSVAVKVMHAALADDRTFVKRFWREANAAARLKHANTVQVLEYGVDGGTVFIAMEYLAGQDLFDVLARERRFSEKRSAGVMLQICDALSAAHDQGIVHRDLKPENVMLMADPGDPSKDVIKVLDFGIAKIMDRDQGDGDAAPPSGPVSSGPMSALTQVGTVVGTPEYMSPEQCRGEAIDPRSDVYACGVLLYRLLAGRAPFMSDSVVEVAMSHVTKEPPPPSSFAPGLNAKLEQVILTALAKWPAQRQQSARELADEIRALLPELSGAQPRAAGRLGLSSGAAPPRIAEAGGGAGKAASGKAPGLPGVPSEVTIAAEARRSGPAPARKSDPAKSEPAKAEPAKVEPAKIETAKEEPAKVEPAKVEPAAPAVAPVEIESAPVEATDGAKGAVTVRRPAPPLHGVEAIPPWGFAVATVILWLVLWALRKAGVP
jgi:eukaryotic-like serine/threonine-protein kinase